ncbi:hypothetical protein TeGR_g14592 [Tetraparma gracilis]|uniref:Uncharacterized protein n=1 Tax=Tetraparma gracilis TaxID=2962635 RepID=A0ABQ6N9Z5_9STRA|nr:hypothetical protein TeGR_g14592 [Tetraparma gracilis]
MYDSILLSGSRRFLVPISHPDNGGKGDDRVSEVAAVFYLTELNDVSERSNDAVKYVVDHAVMGLAKIVRFENPDAWRTKDTFLRAECSVLEWDEGLARAEPAASTAPEPRAMLDPERLLLSRYASLLSLQQSSSQPVRFTSSSPVSSAPGLGPDSLYGFLGLWQRYLESLARLREAELQGKLQDKLLAYLSESGGSTPPQSLSFESLPKELKGELRSLQGRLEEELVPMTRGNHMQIQYVLQLPTHEARVACMSEMVDTEIRRINAVEQLKKMFPKEKEGGGEEGGKDEEGF